jgi:hypothetical protein
MIPVGIECQALNSSVTVLRWTYAVSLLEIWTSISAGQLVQRFNGPVFAYNVNISLFHEYSYYCLDLNILYS